MMAPRLISICIPCYNNVDSLRKLLDSVQAQTYRDFEVIITDDSPNESVKELVDRYMDKMDLKYFKNPVSLGSPENWNKAIGLATGEWIKIMHHDDWFTDEQSLGRFAAHATPGRKFIFSDYINSFEETGQQVRVNFPMQKMPRLRKHPEILIANNLMGNPSGTLVHHSLKSVQYDPRLIWRVDLDYYMQLLKKGVPCDHIAEPLITVGMIDTQITRSVQLNPAVEIPEAYILLEKYGRSILQNLIVYDAYWRMFRNMQIRDKQDLQQYSKEDWGNNIDHMLKNLSKCKADKLQKGWYSKFKMFCSFISRPDKMNN